MVVRRKARGRRPAGRKAGSSWADFRSARPETQRTGLRGSRSALVSCFSWAAKPRFRDFVGLRSPRFVLSCLEASDDRQLERARRLLIDHQQEVRAPALIGAVVAVLRVVTTVQQVEDVAGDLYLVPLITHDLADFQADGRD